MSHNFDITTIDSLNINEKNNYTETYQETNMNFTWNELNKNVFTLATTPSGDSTVGEDKAPVTELLWPNVSPAVLSDLRLLRDCEGNSRTWANRDRLPLVIRDIGGGGCGRSSPVVTSTRS